jgi:hypothetical protein
MLKLRRPGVCLAVLAVFLLHSVPAVAQQAPAGQSVGVVTTLQGQATVGRQPLPQPVPLHFKDDVFFRDQITTRERSTVRLLLGGRGSLTIREQSQVTLDESVAPDGTRRSVVGLLVGKIGAAIARALMRPGEVIEIQTPNAVAAVRGTVLIAEYVPPQGSAEGAKPILLASSAPGPFFAQAGGAGGASNFYVVSGQVTITPQGQAPVTLGPMQAVSVTATPAGVQAGAVRNVTQTQINDAAQGLQTGKTHTGEAEGSRTAQGQIQVADALANAITGGPGGQGPQGGGGGCCPPLQLTPPQPPPTSPDNTLPAGPLLTLNNATLGLAAGTSLATFNAGTANAITPIEISGGGTAVVTAPLLPVTGDTITHDGPMVSMQTGATLVGSPTDTTTPLLIMEGTTLTNTGGAVFTLGGDALLTFFGPLLSLPAGATAELAGIMALGDTSQVALGPASAVVIPSGTSLTLTAPGFSLTGASQLNTFAGAGGSGHLISLTGGSLTGPPTGSLVEVSAGSLSAAGALVNLEAGSTLALSGPVLTVGGTGSVAAANVVTLGAPLITPSGQPLLAVSGGSLATTGSLATLGADLTLGGPFLAQSGGQVSAGADALAVGSHTLTSGAAPVFALTGGTLSTTNDAHLVSLNGGTATLGGPLLSLAMGPSESTPTVNIAGDVLHMASAVVGPPSGSLIDVSAGSLSAAGDLLNLGAEATATLHGPVLTVSGGQVSAANVLNLAAPLTTPSGQPAVQVSDGSLSTTGSLATLGANLTLGGALLAQSGGAVTTGGDALAVGSHTLTSGPTPVFDLTGGTLTTTNDAHLVSLNGGTATLGGPLLSLAMGSAQQTPTVTIAGDLLHVASTVTGPPSMSLVSAAAGSLTAGGDLFRVGSGGHLSLSGPLVAASDSSLTAAASRILGGGSAGVPPIWEPNFGTLVPNGRCDDCTTGLPGVALGFSFPFQGQNFTNAVVSTNGFLWLGGDQGSQCCNPSVPLFLAGLGRVSVGWTDWDPRSVVGGVMANTFPGRAVFTWDGVPEYFGGSHLNNRFQVQLLSDGRIVLGYETLHALDSHDLLIGVTPGGGVADPGGVHFLAAAPFSTGTTGTVYELFTTGESFGLDGAVLVFTPNASGGWDVSTTGSSLGGIAGAVLSILDGGELTQSGNAALFDLLRTALASNGHFLFMSGQSRLSLGGPLLNATDSPLTIAGSLVSISGGGQLTSTTTDPLIKLTRGTHDIGGGIGAGSGSLLDLRGVNTDAETGRGTDVVLQTGGTVFEAIGATVNLSGATQGILVDTAVVSGGGALLRIRDGATLTATTSLPLMQFTNSTVNMDGAFFNLGSNPGKPGSTATLAGPLLGATNSAFDSGPLSSFMSVNDGSTFMSTTTNPLLTVSGGSITTKGHVVRIGLGNQYNPPGSNQLVPTGSQAPVNATLHGPLLSATDASVTATNSVLTIRDNATFTSMTTAPLIQLGGNPGSTLTLGGPDPDPASPTFGQQVNSQVFGVQPILTTPFSASAELWGPVLSATNTTISTTDRILAVFSLPGASATLTSHTADPFVQLTGGSVTMSGTFSPPTSSPGGTTTNTSGRFLAMSSPDPAAPATFTLAGPLLSSTGTTFEGHNHFLNFGDNAHFTSTGTDPLVQLGGVMLSINGTQTFTPISGPPVVTTFGDFLRVSGGGATFNLAGPLLRVTDNSQITIPAGSLVSFNGGASLTLTESGPALDSANSHITIGGPVFAFRGGSHATITGGPMIRLTGGSLTAGSFGSDDGAGDQINITGALLDATGATINFGNVKIPQAGPTNTSVFTISVPAGVPEVRLINSTLTDTSTDSLTQFSDGTSTYDGLLLVASGSTITLGGRLVSEGSGQHVGHVTTTSTDPLLQLSASTVTSGDTLLGLCCGSLPSPPSLSLAGPLLSDSGSTFTIGGSFLQVRDGATLNYTSALPTPPALMQFSGSTVSLNGNLFQIRSNPGTPGSTVTLAGPVMTANNTTFGTGLANNFFNVRDGATFTSTSNDPVLQLTGSTITSGKNIVRIARTQDGSGSEAPVSATVAGPLLSATDSTITAINELVSVGDRTTLHGTGTGPLIQLGGESGTLVILGGTDPDPTSPTFGQPIFPSVFGVGHRPSPLPVAPTSVEIAGPVLSSTNSHVFTSGRVLGIFGQAGAGSTVSSTTQDPLVQVNGGTLTMAGVTSTPFGDGTLQFMTGSFLQMGSPDPTGLASLTVAGPLLYATNATVSSQNHFLDIQSNALVTSTAAGAAVQLESSPLTVVGIGSFTNPGGTNSGFFGNFLNICCSNASASLAGPLLLADNSPLTVVGSLVSIVGGGQLVSTTTAPLIKLVGGTHEIGAGTFSGTIQIGPQVFAMPASLLDLRGMNMDAAGLGTDVPLQTAGAFFEANGATVNLSGTGNMISIDTALLAASAPIVKLINSTLNTSSAGDAVTGAMRIYQSSVTSTGPVFGLENSILNVQSGPLLSLTGGSSLTVNGDFASLTNGSRITVVNGPLIRVSGSSTGPTSVPSTLTVTGGLVNFGGTGGNQVIVNNSILPTGSPMSGLPVNVGGGGSSISIGPNPIKNPGLGSVTINGTPAGAGPFTGSLIQATGGGKVTITAP